MKNTSERDISGGASLFMDIEFWFECYILGFMMLVIFAIYILQRNGVPWGGIDTGTVPIALFLAPGGRFHFC